MRNTTYRYNPVTCRYEHVPFGAIGMLKRVVIFLLVSSFLFFLMLYIHGSLFTTQLAKDLKRENKALAYHHALLTNELVSVQASLASLHDIDKSIQRKLVNDKTPTLVIQTFESKIPKNRDKSPTRLLHNTKIKTKELHQRAVSNNFYFANTIAINSKELTLLTNIPSLQPVENSELTRLTSGYGLRTDPFHKRDYFHGGIDFVAPRGSSVVASASGVVTLIRKSDLQMGDGNQIEIDHGNGFKTRYKHLGEIVVKSGQKIKKGAVIASIGMSGGSISPHVHFEVIRNNKLVDPITYLLQDVSSNDFTALQLLAKQKNQSLD